MDYNNLFDSSAIQVEMIIKNKYTSNTKHKTQRQ